MYAAAAVKLAFSTDVRLLPPCLYYIRYCCGVPLRNVLWKWCLWPCVRRVTDEIRFRGGMRDESGQEIQSGRWSADIRYPLSKWCSLDRANASVAPVRFLDYEGFLVL